MEYGRTFKIINNRYNKFNMKYLIQIITVCMLLTSPVFAADKSDVKKLPDDQRMEWWRDASFGMFIHWGLYSIPGGTYKGDTCKGGAEWIMNKLHIPVKEYEQFAGQFNPVKFNADQWVSIAKDAGMKYIVLTTKHHEGFCMWDSKITDYDIMDASPFKRDIVKELSEACKKQGIKFCVYYSIVDWHHPQAQALLFPNYNAGQKDSTAWNPEFPKYFENYLKPQVKELLTNYGDIGVVWFDGDWIPDYKTEMGKELYKFIREIQPNTIVNNRVDKGREGMKGMDKEGQFAGDFGTPEQEVPATGISSDWESCMTMNGSWGYKPSDKHWKSSEDLIRHLIDIVSKGGNFLLNVGPDSQGMFPQKSITRLKAIGKWTKVNAEAIYGAKASPYNRPDWGRYTSKPGIVYAHVFDWPKDGKLYVNKNMKIKRASLLEHSWKRLKVNKDAKGLYIEVPTSPTDTIASVVKIIVK